MNNLPYIKLGKINDMLIDNYNPIYPKKKMIIITRIRKLHKKKKKKVVKISLEAEPKSRRLWFGTQLISESNFAKKPKRTWRRRSKHQKQNKPIIAEPLKAHTTNYPSTYLSCTCPNGWRATCLTFGLLPIMITSREEPTIHP